MANIPGISGYIQPGTFARDRVVSKGVSIPGGVRVLTIMGLGETEVVLVDGAVGSGQDGTSTPSGASPNGRFFLIPEAPLESGRVKVFLNGAELTVYEGKFNGSDTVQSGYDCQVDLSTGVLGLQSASFEDQNGLLFAAATSNVGNGVVETGEVGNLDELAILDPDTPSETWTLRCNSVLRDSNGASIKGQAKFSLTGSVSGQLRDSNGNFFSFTDSFKEGTGTIHRNDDLTTAGQDGYVLMNGETGRADGYGAILLGTAVSAASSLYVAIPLGASTQPVVASADADGAFFDRIQVGDYFVTTKGGNPSDVAHKIEAIYKKEISDMFTGGNSTVDYTHDSLGYAVLKLDSPVESSSTFTLNTVDTTLDLTTEEGIAFTHGNILSSGIGNDFKIVATNAFVDETGADTIFDSRDVGKVLLVTGDAEDRYTVTAVTDGRNIDGATDSVLRVHKYGDSSTFFPTLESEQTTSYSLVETNGLLTIGVDGINATTAFEVGDKFTFKVSSKVLAKDDVLEARYIATANLDDPEFFTEPSQLFSKHGNVSTLNTLSLGAQMAYENGAPGILAIQCKPSVPRKTEVTLIDEKSSAGVGGIQVDKSNYELNDVMFSIPIEKTGGYRKGRPDSDTAVAILRIRDGVESQIFPNKSAFYSSAQGDIAGKQEFMNSSSTYSYSYTITDSPVKEYGSGSDGAITLSGTTASFSSATFNFDAEHAGKKILIKSLTNKNGVVLDDDSDIKTYLGAGFSEDTTTTFLDTVTISSITSDSTVVLSGAFNATNTATNIRFTVIDDSDTTNTGASLLLNKQIFESNALKNGDGLKIKYIDQNDADFFDTNWFNAFDKLEAYDTQIIVPLPDQTKSNIFQAAVSHCEIMSSIANRKERVALIGAISGVDDQALIGNKLVAIENIGIVEGIQGDDVEEVLNGDIEDLQNFKLSDNFTSNRCVYFFPDQIVRNIVGTNTLIDGYYVAAAAGGRLAGTQNVAIPLTNKVLTGFNILRDKVYKQSILNSLGNEGATVLQPVAGGGRILAGRTTSNSGYVEDEEISIIFIRDRVKQIMRSSLQGYIGIVQDVGTDALIRARVISILNSLVTQGLIESFSNATVERDKVDPRQINVLFRFVPIYPVNYVFIDIEVGIG